MDFDANKALSRTLGVKVLPMFHFYRGQAGRVASFSASLSKVQRIREELEAHGTPRCDFPPNMPPVLVRSPAENTARLKAHG